MAEGDRQGASPTPLSHQDHSTGLVGQKLAKRLARGHLEFIGAILRQPRNSAALQVSVLRLTYRRDRSVCWAFASRGPGRRAADASERAARTPRGPQL
jgi:hypothetical protein